MTKQEYHASGMRRTRLLLWAIYNRTPLDQVIDDQVERDGAARCKLAWPEYLSLKAAHPDLWLKATEKRQRAVALGRFPPQPWQLREHRSLYAPRRAKVRSERPRFTEWAAKKLIRERSYKRPGLRRRVVDRLFLRVIGL
jgi:hypothetical protein